MIPDGALYEAFLGDMTALYDVSHLLPVHRTKRYSTHPEPTELYVHHSGKLGRPGFAGLYNSSRYVVRYRDWPGCPYHYWIPYEELYDEAEDRVIFRAQPDKFRTYHAGRGPNQRAVAVCLQGNTNTRPASDFQLDCLADLVSWFRERDVFVVQGHCQAPPDGHAKASCPGSHAMAFLSGLRVLNA